MKNELQELFQLAAKYFLKRYKKEGGSQSILAKELGITQSYLSSVTSGSRTASLDLYSQIASRLYGPLDKFLAVGRRIKEGQEPLEDTVKQPEDPVEHLIARLTYYVVDHQRIEKELVEFKKFYETIVEKQHTGILVMDKDNNVVYANRHMEIMSNIPLNAIIGTNPYNVEKSIPDLNVSEFRKKYQEAQDTFEVTSYKNIRTVIPGGRIVFNSGSFYPLSKEGVFDGMICTIYDTTTSHILRKLLIQTLNFSSQGIAIVQQTQPGELPQIYFLNKQFRKIFGLPDFDPSEVPFAESHKLLAANIKNSKKWLDFVKKTISTNKVDARIILTLKNNKQCEWASNPLIDDKGNHWGRIVNITEIVKKTGRKKK